MQERCRRAALSFCCWTRRSTSPRSWRSAGQSSLQVEPCSPYVTTKPRTINKGFLPAFNNSERCSVKVSDFKQELLFSAGVGEERIVEFSCGEWRIFQRCSTSWRFPSARVLSHSFIPQQFFKSIFLWWVMKCLEETQITQVWLGIQSLDYSVRLRAYKSHK